MLPIRGILGWLTGNGLAVAGVLQAGAVTTGALVRIIHHHTGGDMEVILGRNKSDGNGCQDLRGISRND